jgi:predicted esterase
LDTWEAGRRLSRELYGAGRYREARDVLEGLWESASERRDFMWSGMLACHVALDDLTGAATTLRRALNQGCMWRVSLLADPTLAPVLADAACREIVDEARRRVAARNLRPEVLVESASGPGVHPLLLVLHGATGTAAGTLPHWLPAREPGYTVAAGQSSQPASAEGFCWDPPRERVWQDLDAIASALPTHGRVVTAGFSQGAWVALNAALRGNPFPAAGVVMVGPFVPSPAQLEPGARRLRVAILAGADDPIGERVGDLEALLVERGHQVALEVIPGLGHAYPEDFAARLPGLLNSVSRSRPIGSSS